MTPRTRIVACFSEGTAYEEMAEGFRAEVEALGIESVFSGFRDRGGWHRNTRQKAIEIRNFRETLQGPLLYVDVDASVKEDVRPYFDQVARDGFDWGAHWFAGPAKGKNRSDVCRCVAGGLCSKSHRLLSGTLFLGDTPGCRRLLDEWVAENNRREAAGDLSGGGQKNLWRVCREFTGELRMADLPGRYCYVFDKGWAYPEDEPALIVHHIASRQHRPKKAPTV